MSQRESPRAHGRTATTAADAPAPGGEQRRSCRPAGASRSKRKAAYADEEAAGGAHAGALSAPLLLLALAVLALAPVAHATPAVLSSLVVVPSAEFLLWSFDVCTADPACAAAFPAGADQTVFDEMMLFFLTGLPAGVAANLTALLEPCAANCVIVPLPTNCSAGSCCAAQQALWLVIMQQARLCQDTEEWLPDHGCHCIEGRNCAEDCIGQLGSSLWILYAVAGALLLLVLIYWAWSTNNSAALSRALIQLQHKFAGETHLAKARLFIAKVPPPAASVSRRIGSPTPAPRPLRQPAAQFYSSGGGTLSAADEVPY